MPHTVYDWPTLKLTIQKHLMLFLVMCTLGGSFFIAGLLGIIWGTTLSVQTIAAIAIVIGCLVLGFNIVSSYSSCMYYYEKAVLKKFGKHITAIVTNKTIQEEKRLLPRRYKYEDPIEQLLSISYRYHYASKQYEGSSFLHNKALFDAIKVNTDIPIAVMQNKPEISSVKTNMLSKTLKVNLQADTAPIPQPLVEE